MLDLKVIGVSFHVGSGCTNNNAYNNAVRLAHSVFKLAKESFEMDFNLLDIGGGFPGSESEGISFQNIAKSLNPVINELFPPGCGVYIIAEPGRFFVAKCQYLAVQVLRVKKLNNRLASIDTIDSSYQSRNIPVSFGNDTKTEDVNSLYKCSNLSSIIQHSDETETVSCVPRSESRVYILSEGIFGSLKDSLLLNVNFIPQILLKSSILESVDQSPLKVKLLHKSHPAPCRL